MDGMLSQDEINALLSGMNTGGDDTSDSSTATTTIPEDNANDNTDGGFTLTESEKMLSVRYLILAWEQLLQHLVLFFHRKLI